MASKFPKPIAALIFATLLLAFLSAAIPLKPPGKIWIATGETAVMAVLMLCASLYDVVRRSSSRPSIPLVWLVFAAGFGCISMSLKTMAQTWGWRHEHLPFEQVNLLLGGGAVFLLVGAIGFGFAAEKRRQMDLASLKQSDTEAIHLL